VLYQKWEMNKRMPPSLVAESGVKRSVGDNDVVAVVAKMKAFASNSLRGN
jgi:hypothetical protein